MTQATSRWRNVSLMVLVIAVTVNLRPILTSIGPLLEDIRLGTGIGYQQAALLTALPVLCMGLVPLLQPWLRRWLSEQGGLLLGLGAIGLACLWRLLLGNGTALIASAVLAGMGVAFVQALMPGLVNRWFSQRLALAMGVYSAALMSGGGIAAVLGPRVAEYFGHWQAGLGIWGLPVLLALLMLGFIGPKLEAAAGRGGSGGGHFFGSRRAWLLAVYFGLINGGYTSMVAWLPAYYQQVGGSARGGGELVGLMTIFQVVGALGLPMLLRRFADRRPGLWLALLAQLAGIVGLLLAPALSPGLWVGLIGFGLGACFSLSLTLTLEHLKDPRQAGGLAAFVQGIGFIITGLVPYLTGWLRDISGNFQASWTLLTVTVVLMLLVTGRFVPTGYGAAMGSRATASTALN